MFVARVLVMKNSIFIFGVIFICEPYLEAPIEKYLTFKYSCSLKKFLIQKNFQFFYGIQTSFSIRLWKLLLGAYFMLMSPPNITGVQFKNEKYYSKVLFNDWDLKNIFYEFNKWKDYFILYCTRIPAAILCPPLCPCINSMLPKVSVVLRNIMFLKTPK